MVFAHFFPTEVFCECMVVTWGLAVVFAGYSGFLQHLHLASRLSRNMAEKVTKNQNSNSVYSMQFVWSRRMI